MNNKLISIFEIFLIVTSTFAFAYMVSETNDLVQYLPIENKESKFLKWFRAKALEYLSHGLVSAQAAIQTCLTNCQEYPAQTCSSQCTSCFPGRRTEVSACNLGTCYDSSTGLCTPRSPRASCISGQGEWFEQEPAQCNRECCLINPDGNGGGSQTSFSTEQQCNHIGQTIGAQISWVPVLNDIECINKATIVREGACVLDLDVSLNKYNCRFTNEASCRQSGGTFHVDLLCTNPQLNTKCEITQNTKCFEEKDGVYFIDSCNQRANIYDSTKLSDISYWSSVVNIGQSCSLGSGNNDLANQKRCGNCNYLAGSKCSTPKNGIDETPFYGQYVCSDLSCTDENGNERKHGSSWCAFDSRIGTDGAEGSNEERSVDVPGSRHYKKSCYEGEVITSPCAEYRNGVCVESDASQNGFTTADCRMNTGVLCSNYNKDQESLEKCEQSPDCFLKHVEIDKFKFDVCAPKYSPGFEIGDNVQNGAEMICSAGTQTCTYYEKKSISGRWSCKINCGCQSAQFVETMNNLCMSLGDCGGEVNLAGEYSKNYVISGNRNPTVTNAYIEGLRAYMTPLRGQRVSNYNSSQIAAMFGINGPVNFDELAAKLGQFGLGASVALSMYTGVATAPSTFAMAGWGGAFNAALVGAGIGYIIGMAFGLEGDDLIIAVVVGAAAFGIASYAGLFTTLGATGPVGWAVAIVVAIIIAIMSIAGVGKYRERRVTFECLPWQPPNGGANCDKCGENGFECTQYKCSSLGKTCRLLNSGTRNAACVDISPNDASPPIISFNATSLPNGFSYQQEQNGILIKNDSESDGCLKEYSIAKFGISLNEDGQCKIDTQTSPDYESMDGRFFDSSSNDYLKSHEEIEAMPTLDSLEVAGIDPARRGNHDLYIRCIDGNGNDNDAEYVVRFCVSPANDVQEPVINEFVPESPGFTSLTSTGFDLRFYTNEPATCKWSGEDKDYNLMENDAYCLNEINSATTRGWLCQARLNVTQETNNYYFRCADQPWLGINISETSTTLEEGRNVMPNSRTYEVKKTTTPLSITYISPNNQTIYTGTEPILVRFEVRTTGGIDNGKAFCQLSWNNNGFNPFFETSLSTHKQSFSTMFSGNHIIDIKCEDRAGNIALSQAQFDIVVDSTAPIITRAYNSGSSLTIVTNEAATCEYAISSCDFNIGTGILLGGLDRVHTMPYNNGVTYHIKCKDVYSNVGTCLSLSQGY